MDEIRALEHSHLPEVAALELKILHKLDRPASTAFQQYFASIFLENPWRSDDLPSLVYLHQGKVAGFLGVVPREMEFAGRRIRVAVASQFMVDRDLFRGSAGLELLRKYFGGPQDLSYTDGATEAAHLSWTAAGARAAPLYSLEWTRVLKPVRYFGGLVEEKGGMWRALAKASTPAAILADAAIAWLPFRSVGAPVSDCMAEEASVGDLLETIREIGWRDPLKPAYDEQSFPWLIDQAASASGHGALRLGVVRHPAGERAGWFVYFAKRGGVSQVLQLGARRHTFDDVLLALLADAWQQGAVAVRGQAIPRHLTNLTMQHCGLRHLGSGVLIHSREQALMDTILEGDAALSRLDGEWWMRFSGRQAPDGSLDSVAQPIRADVPAARPQGRQNVIQHTTDDPITTRLTACFQTVFPNLPPAQVPHADQASVEAWDSVAAVMLFNVIDDEFGIHMDFDRLAELGSFERIHAYLSSQLQQS